MRPRALGPYLLVERVGQGGMGTVYRAKDTADGRMVAVKVLHDSRVGDPRMAARFRQEARILQVLRHPQIAAYYDSGKARLTDPETGVPQDLVYLALEWVSGRDLEEELEGRIFAPREAIRIGLEVASALATAHGLGVIHRDLKPGNLRLMPSGGIKLLDFGLAKILEDAEAELRHPRSFNTTLGSVLGTAPYLAPEQLTGGEVGAHTDLFALGVILYEMLTGQVPFGGKNLVQILDKVLRGQPQPIREISADVPPALEEVVLRLLSKPPEDRFSSAKSLTRTLERLAD